MPQTTILYDSSGRISEIVEYTPPTPNSPTREIRTVIEYDGSGNIEKITELESVNVWEEQEIKQREEIAKSLPGIYSGRSTDAERVYWAHGGGR